MSEAYITKMVAGKNVEVPIKDVWPSLVKIITLARLATFRGDDWEKYREYRNAILAERLTDLDGLTFHPETKT